MGRIAVFDSGLGSLSIIQAIRKVTKADVIYFADQKHYPYGKKSHKELRQIIEMSVDLLARKFDPDIIVVGSNTPTILFPDLFVRKAVIGVQPPLLDAIKKTKTKSIAILGTLAMTKSKQLDDYIADVILKNTLVTKIDSTKLIDLVETGRFLNDLEYCKNIIKNFLTNTFHTKTIDVVTLSSTHLSFIHPLLKEIFPQILFLDPAMSVAQKIIKKKNFHPAQKNSLKIFSSGNISKLQKTLHKLQIKNKVHRLEF